ncbi:MAG: tRNA uracil 4-sulfurtransferase ThiI [Lachnospiraceae bacterium]|nr:tRNA uracil 4-sulfurtransferase ThiI [Lachnospiraceae bacterium]
MYSSFLIKYGEIGIKGNNRHVFEDALCRRIREALKPLDGEFDIKKERGRIYVNCSGDWHYDETVTRLSRVFGIVGICPVVVLEASNFEALREGVVAYIGEEYPNSTASFKVKARRVNKSFEMKSMEIDAELGGAILEAYPSMHVDVHNPDILIDIEIREFIYVYSKIIPGPGGMPVGTGGSATLLLSGGIDSPVAGWMVAKRGVTLDAVYFHAPPYTSERAKQKVVDLAKEIAVYTGPIKLHIVNFTDIQLYIYDTCPHEELTIIMRRYMMRIAEHFAKENHSMGLVTGESIGQVASQTMQSLMTTNAVCTLPVYRPLIAFDKNDIVAKAKEIGTYETSILPYEDCCTIFVAKHPVTKPNLKTIEHSEMHLKEKIDDLFKEAIDTTEVIYVR